MRRYRATATYDEADTETLQSLQISFPLNGGAQGSLEVFGGSVHNPNAITLRGYIDDELVGVETASFKAYGAPHSGSYGYVSRTRAISLQDFSASLDVPAEVPPEAPKQPWALAMGSIWSMDAPLGSGLPSEQDCEDYRNEGLLTNIEFANLVMMNSGVMGVLVVIPGPGLVVQPAPADYDISGKTVMEVLNDLVLTNGVRWWMENHDVFVDGRELPLGDFETPSGYIEDVLALSFQDDIPRGDPEPVLQDYLDGCAENMVASDGATGTVETQDSATYNYTGSSDDGEDGFNHSNITITKQNGNVVSERIETWGSIGNFFDQSYYGLKEVVTKENVFHPQVPGALLSSVETTYTHPDISYAFLGSTRVGPLAPITRIVKRNDPYIERQVRVQQQWHAEGWLKTKDEFSKEKSGFYYDEGLDLQPLYRMNYKSTTYIPIGKGMWRVEYRVRKAKTSAVWSISGGGIGAALTYTEIVIDSHSDFYYEITDQAPPSVSIPLPDCYELPCPQKAQIDFERDHAAWAAAEVNQGPRRTWNVTFKTLMPQIKRGDSFGGGIVLDVSHSMGDQPAATNINVGVRLAIL